MIYALKVSRIRKHYIWKRTGAGAERITMHLKYVYVQCIICRECAFQHHFICLCIYANICTLRKVWENNAINVMDIHRKCIFIAAHWINCIKEERKLNQINFGLVFCWCVVSIAYICDKSWHWTTKMFVYSILMCIAYRSNKEIENVHSTKSPCVTMAQSFFFF